ncbi:MAG TPA: hypothetical protein VF006_33490 [Longimicrobium sp.]
MKLRLQLDDLRIDSFDTSAPPKAKGTVFGGAVHLPYAVHLRRMPNLRELQHLRRYL